jgi:Cu/Ag efflux pump CusA
MAVTILAGLMFATLLIMVVVPVLYATRRLPPDARQGRIVRQAEQGVYNP